jgi:hypothetical protein
MITLNFALSAGDDLPILEKSLFELAAHHRIPFIVILYDEDKRHLEISERTVYPSDVFFAFNEDEAICLDERFSNGWHCFTYMLENGEYVYGKRART